MAAKRVIIKTAEQAKAYLASIDHTYKLEDGKVVQTQSCRRCGGSGMYSHYHGVCFECGGVRSRWLVHTPIVAYAKKVRRRELELARKAKKAAERAAKREERKLEGQRDWCEANGFGRVTFKEKDAIVAERRRAQEAKAGEIHANATYVGTVGERTKGLELVLVHLQQVGRWDNWMHVFETPDGHRVVYFGGMYPLQVKDLPGPQVDMPIGYSFTCSAMVAAQDVYVRRDGSAEPRPQTTIKNLRARKVTGEYLLAFISEAA